MNKLDPQFMIDGDIVSEQEFNEQTKDIPKSMWNTICSSWQTHRVAQTTGQDGHMHTYRTSIPWQKEWSARWRTTVR